MPAIFVLFVVASAAPFASAGYSDYGKAGYGSVDALSSISHQLEGYPIKTIDLGTFVGKHNLPPDTVRITKTVAVKIPQPYRVNVPRPIPYAVSLPKPYPVEVPKYIKIKEQVPVYLPTNTNHQPSSASSYSEGSAYFAGSSESGHGPQEPLYSSVPGGFGGFEQHNQPESHSGGNGNIYSNYQQQSGDSVSEYHQQLHNPNAGSAESRIAEYQPNYDSYPAAADPQPQFQAQEQSPPTSYAEQLQPNEESQYPVEHSNPISEHTADYSARQIIYTNPRQGIAAYKVVDGHGIKEFVYKQEQVDELPDVFTPSHTFKSEQKVSGQSENFDNTDGNYQKNYQEKLHEMQEVQGESSGTSEKERPNEHIEETPISSRLMMYTH